MRGQPGRSRVNSFDALRLVGATAVLVSHSFALTGWREPRLGPDTLGGLGVLLFFGISGFLVTQSWLSDANLWRFAVKRALRILPAFAAMLAVLTFGIGLAVTTVSPGAYLSSRVTWHYFADNLLMVPRFGLPGVFVTHASYSNIANGSIWTLTHEVHAYVIVAVLGATGVLSRRRLALPALILVALLARRFPDGVHGIGEPRLLAAFVCGAALYIWADKVPWNGVVATAVAAGAAVACFAIPLHAAYALALAVPYLTIYVAFRAAGAGKRITSHGDFSYGVYLWAWPFQMLILLAWSSISPWALIVLSLPASFAAAAISWHAVERPSLLAKRFLRRKPELALMTAPAPAVAASARVAP